MLISDGLREDPIYHVSKSHRFGQLCWQCFEHAVWNLGAAFDGGDRSLIGQEFFPCQWCEWQAFI
jgi:hypothetical protein